VLAAHDASGLEGRLNREPPQPPRRGDRRARIETLLGPAEGAEEGTLAAGAGR